jgi:hypothetical protein
MAVFGLILEKVALLVRTGILEQRLQSARSSFRHGGGNPWFWPLIGLIILAGTVCTLAGISLWKESRRKKKWQAFTRKANKFGLSQGERGLLYEVAKLTKVDPPVDIFSSQDHFEEGAKSIETYVPSGKSHPDVCGACGFIHTVREKLGFDTPIPDDKPTSVNLGKIHPGSVLTVIRQTAPDRFEVTACGHTEEGELLVQPEPPLECHPGQSWVVRYPDGGNLWEFDGWVSKNLHGVIAVKPAGALRLINRRRFARTPARKRAHVARFPFTRKPEELPELPEFVAADVAEIGGPGLRLKAPILVSMGEVMLVVTELQRGEVVEAVGVVRRVDHQDPEGSDFAVELVGLTSSDVSELVKQTNAAAVKLEKSRIVAEEPTAARET